MTDNQVGTESQQSELLYRLIPCISTLDTIVINKDIIRVGRSPTCDVVVEENKINRNYFASVSKVHFTLTLDSESNVLYLTDLSKNGTFISGTKAVKHVQIPLRDKAKIAIGHKDCNVYTIEVIENLPDTLTPVGNYVSLSIQSKILPIWGRLISYMLHLESCDLHDDQFKVGRSHHCDVVIENTKISRIVKNLFSKEHFLICKDPNHQAVTLIKDMSKTGTYLNDRLIGKNNISILQDNDIISIGKTKLKLYLYKSMSSEDNMTYLPPDLKQIYVPCKLLGSGAVGEVRLAFEKHTCKMVAIKKILKGRSATSQMYKLNHPNKIQTEISILQTLKHPFIIKMDNIVETPEEVYIVLEYMRGGELSNRIKSNDPLTESNSKFLFYQMILAVQYLHSKGITHRDLKPDNVLLQSDEVDTLLKVSDFGLSKVTEGNDMMMTVCGTMCYIAPEMLCSRIYNRQVDVWSLGVILFYMLSKRLPFKLADRSAMAELIKSGLFVMEEEHWKGVSFTARDLVKKMLKVNPQQRITIEGILKHPWFAKDSPMQYKVQYLLESNLETDEIVMTYNLEPPLKRIRCASDESRN